MTTSIHTTRPTSVPLDTVGELWAAIQADRRTHAGRWTAPGFQALLAVRVGTFGLGRSALPRKLTSAVYRVLRRRARIRYGIELYATTAVGKDVQIAHHGTIVIHPRAVLGDRCLIRQGVTIGGVNEENHRSAPILGSDVEIGVGAILVGSVRIGDGARIGPNAVVTTDIPSGAIVTAPRPRIMAMP